MAVDTTRDNAPIYLAQYAARRSDLAASDAADSAGITIADEPPFVLRARERSTRRALAELDRPSGPPGRTEAFANDTVSPRELQYPESFRRRLSTTIDVRLIRHGQTQGYIADGALTPLGHWQAHRKGQDLAKSLKEGTRVVLPYAPTARARETAEALHGGLLQALARYGIGDVTIEDPVPNDWFKNFQVWVGGTEMDVTAAFQEFANLRETHQRSGVGDRPGWVVEMDRFFRVEQAGGDPITHWLSHPMQYFEPSALVVRRHWKGVVELVRNAGPDTKIYVCGHSGPIRAVATSAVGHDPGEPRNTEDVRMKVYDDLEHAVVTYRNRGIEVEIPTSVTPSWFA